MHISEGILSGPVLFSGYALAVAGTAMGLKKMDHEKIALVGILSASFFVASLIHVPVGPSNAHLVLNGLVGLILGWGAFPAILVALLLQAMFFQLGGITTLGVNTIIMAAPAVVSAWVFGAVIRRHHRWMNIAGFACGALSVALSAVITGAVLVFTEENFFRISAIIMAAHVPVMIIEGVVTAACVTFLNKVRPEMLDPNAIFKESL